MNCKLIAIDLDDTLVSEHRDISEKDRNAILRATSSGVHVVFASGRGLRGILPYNKMFDLNGYTITTGGGQIFFGSTTVLINLIDSNILHKLLEWAENRGIYYQTYLGDGYFFSRHTEWTDYYRSRSGYEGVLDISLSKNKDLKAAKIIFFDEPAKVNDYAMELHREFPSLNIMTSSPSFLEIHDARTSKGAALSYVAERLGIDSAETIAIGDSELDIPMFEYAGIAAAVTDATEYVKATANYVCTSKSDWVAEVIDRFVP